MNDDNAALYARMFNGPVRDTKGISNVVDRYYASGPGTFLIETQYIYSIYYYSFEYGSDFMILRNTCATRIISFNLQIFTFPVDLSLPKTPTTYGVIRRFVDFPIPPEHGTNHDCNDTLNDREDEKFAKAQYDAHYLLAQKYGSGDGGYRAVDVASVAAGL